MGKWWNNVIKGAGHTQKTGTLSALSLISSLSAFFSLPVCSNWCGTSGHRVSMVQHLERVSVWVPAARLDPWPMCQQLERLE